MINKRYSGIGPAKKIIYIIITAIILILICFIYLLNKNKKMEQEDNLIINVFGKQRMYTQMISKDVDRMYGILLDLEAGSFYLPEDEISRRLSEIRDSLMQARNEFSTTLTEIHNNSIHYKSERLHINSSKISSSEYLMEIDSLWKEFDMNVEVIINAEQVDAEVAKATTFIDDNNLELLNLSDQLLEQVLKEFVNKYQVIEYSTYFLIGLLLLFIIASLYQLQRFLLQPFSELYRGIAEIGLENYPVKTSFPTRKKVAPIVTEFGTMFLKTNNLISLIENINNNASFMETLQFINRTFTAFIPYNYIGVALMCEDRSMLKASYGVSDGTIIGLPDKVLGSIWPIGHTSLKDLLQTGKARIINDLEEYCEGSPIKLYNKIMLEAGVRASITLPLNVSGEPVGVIFFSSKNKNVYNQEHIKILHILANSIAISLNKNILVSDILYSSILALAKLAEARDEDTGEHMDRMSIYSREIAQLLYDNNIYAEEINIEYIDFIEKFSPLHDIGKVGILDGILLKQGKLTPEEFQEMKKHTAFGADVLRTAERNMQRKGKSLFGVGIEIAEGHHEKWDGSGYPFGKKGNEIPLSARIVAVADVFDALTSKRPYKEAFSLEASLQIIQEGRGSHFDPVIIDTLMANRNKFEALYYNLRAKDIYSENVITDIQRIG